MLDKKDLEQLRKILREEIEMESEVTRNDLRGEIKLAKMEVLNTLNDVLGKLKDQAIRSKKIEKDVKTIVDYFDQEGIKIEQRVRRVEQHLNLRATN